MTTPRTLCGSIAVLCMISPAGHATDRGHGDNAPSTSIKAIDKFCDGLVPLTKVKARRRLFGLFSPDSHLRGDWIEFKRQADLDVAVRSERVFDTAQMWSRKDGAIAISMRITSGSGDWFHYVEYCFRVDGTLARENSTLNTFNAIDDERAGEENGATRERDRYFDTRGNQLKVSQRVLDLKTKEPRPTMQYMDDEEPIYKTVAALPFYAPMNERDTTHTGVAPAGTPPRRGTP